MEETRGPGRPRKIDEDGSNQHKARQVEKQQREQAQAGKEVQEKWYEMYKRHTGTTKVYEVIRVANGNKHRQLVRLIKPDDKEGKEWLNEQKKLGKLQTLI